MTRRKRVHRTTLASSDDERHRMPVAGPVTDDPKPDSPLLPHEHDESPEVALGPPAARIKQGHRDLVQGRVDTEARSNAVRHFERATKDRMAAHSARDRRATKDERT